MRTYQHPIYQDNTMAIRAEYDEEKVPLYRRDDNGDSCFPFASR